MKIALEQCTAGPDSERNVLRGLEAVEKAARQGAALIAFPELSFQPFFPQFPAGEYPSEAHAEPVPGPTTDRFCRAAREFGIAVVINLYERDGERFFDSSPVIDQDGTLKGVTRMVHIIEAQGFHEQGFYHPGDRGAPVFDLALGRLGIAICYDRHYPEYLRALGVKGAQLVVVPQAGSTGEWPEGLFEAELQVASLQNGFFAALTNRVGREEKLEFAGESYVTDPFGQVIARARAGAEETLYAELDLGLIEKSPAKRHFLPDRRPDLYPL